MKDQKEVLQALIQVRDLIDFMEDEPITLFMLYRINDKLYNKLTNDNKNKFDVWLLNRV